MKKFQLKFTRTAATIRFSFAFFFVEYFLSFAIVAMDNGLRPPSSGHLHDLILYEAKNKIITTTDRKASKFDTFFIPILIIC